MLLYLVSHANTLNGHIGNTREKRRTDHEREKETEEENEEWEEEEEEKEEESHEGTANKEHQDALDRSDDGKEAAVLISEEEEEKDLEAEWEQRYRQKQLYLELLNDIELDVSSNATSDNTHNNNNTHNTEAVMEGQREEEVHGDIKHHKRKNIEEEDSEEISSSQETGQPGEIKEEVVVEISPTKRMKKEDGVPVVVVDGCPQSS